jgi:hypothetical protein
MQEPALSRQYGKIPRGGRKQPEASQPAEIQVNITGRHTMEQLALEVQRALAMVQDFGAAGLEKFRFRLLPLDARAEPTILRDRAGQIVTTINIPDEPPEKPYRENEPGLAASAATSERAPGAVPPRNR